ncbi:MAG: hypothetical protein CBCREVIR_2463 [Candidatus Burkholderia crenata]|nr:MAG: hypothetical protein CBCREVIR_2463 [Candidatus Burkholderia crenata]
MRAMSTIDVLRQSVSNPLVIAARQWRRTSQGVTAAYKRFRGLRDATLDPGAA